MEEIEGNPLNTNWKDKYLDCFFSEKDMEEYFKYKNKPIVYYNENKEKEVK